MKSAVVHVVDDDPAMRDSVRWLLQSDGLKVETYASAVDFLSRYRPGDAGCLLLDVRMPGMSGLQLQEILLERNIRIPLVFVTAHGDVPMAVRAVRAGALDFIEKPFDDEVLITLIRRALETDAADRQRYAEELDFAARLATLTPREREVLEYVVAGGLNKVISRELHITIRTVETHRARIMAKLRISSFAELVQRMVMHRLGKPPGHNQHGHS